MFRLGLFLTILLVLPSLAFAKQELRRGYVAKVIDGDTVVVESVKNGRFICRLYGIDAPEMAYIGGKPGQPYGKPATEKMVELVDKKNVEVRLTGAMSHKRDVCFVSQEGVDVNLEMLESGFAWAYKKHLRGKVRKLYISAEEKAKRAKAGLWKQTNPLAPWKFKKLFW